MSVSYILKRYGVPVLMVLAAVVVFKQMAGIKKEQKKGAPKAFVRQVQTLPVTYTALRPGITGSGRVRAWETVNLSPEVTGVILPDEFRLRAGMRFGRGDVLMRIDDRQATYSFHSTVSDLRNALTSLLPELKVDMYDAYERWAGFFAQPMDAGLPELPECGSERETLLVTRYNIFKLYYTLKNMELALQRHTLTAPFAGTVKQSQVNPGDMARAGAAAAVLVRIDLVEIELALPAADAAELAPGMRAAVTVDGRTAAGTVHRISNVLDERMQTVPVFVQASGAGMRGGAYATVRIAGKVLRHALRIPRRALHGGTKVYLIEDGRLVETGVEVAYTGVEDAYITGGPAEGAVLVSEPLQDAVPGMQVRPAGAAEPGPGKGAGKGNGKKDGAAE